MSHDIRAPVTLGEPSTFVEFLEHLREPGAPALLSPVRFGEVMRTDLSTLAAQARVHRNTLRHAPQTESVQQFLRDALRVIRASSDLSGDLGKALFWYRNYPLAQFEYRTPEYLVTKGRTEDVLRYIALLGAGAAG